MSHKTPSPIIAALLILGGTVFGLPGALHAIYTLLDLRNARRLVPVDPSVAQAMANSALRLSGGRTNLWRAWISFNFSHSLGLLLVAVLALWAGFRIKMFPVGIIMPVLTLIGCCFHCGVFVRLPRIQHALNRLEYFPERTLVVRRRNVPPFSMTGMP